MAAKRPAPENPEDRYNSHRDKVVEAMIEAIQNNKAPWQKPFYDRTNDSIPMNPTTGKQYNGINAHYLALRGAGLCEKTGVQDPRWCTYNQAKEQGWQVRKGEKGTQIEKWEFSYNKKVTDEHGKPVFDAEGNQRVAKVRLDRPRVFLATVFHASQIDGIPAFVAEPLRYEWNPIEKAESILRNSGARIQHDQTDAAFYRPSTDTIHLPLKGQFPSEAEYYATATHELGHWTGHSTRLNRSLVGSMGSPEYAREELRAEMASWKLGDKIGVPHDPSNHVSYLAGWVKALQEDPRELWNASRDSDAIVEYIMAFDREREQERGVSEEEHESERVASEAPVEEIAALSMPIEGETPRIIEERRIAIEGISLARRQYSFGDSEAQRAAWKNYVSDVNTLGIVDEERNSLHGWLKKSVQLAKQQIEGGDDKPLTTAWPWLAEGLQDSLIHSTEAARASLADDPIATRQLQRVNAFQNMADGVREAQSPITLNLTDMTDTAILLDAVYGAPHGKRVLEEKLMALNGVMSGRVETNVAGVFQMEIVKLHPSEKPVITIVPYEGKQQTAIKHLRSAAEIAARKAEPDGAPAPPHPSRRREPEAITR